MNMRGQTLSEIKGVVNAIYTGNFTVSDIKNLFSNIRFHVGQKSSLKDVGDFVGHPDERDQGLAVKSAKATAYGIYHLCETRVVGKSLNLREELPFYFKDLLYLNLFYLSNEEIMNNCGKSKGELTKLIENRIVINKEDNATKFWVKDLEDKGFTEQIDKIVASIDFVVGRISAKEDLKQNEIIGALWSYLNGIIQNFNKDQFLEQKSKIMLCILIIIHDTLVKTELDIPAYFYIGFIGKLKKNNNGNYVLDGNETLNIYFRQMAFNNIPGPGWFRPILVTDLKIKDWVEDSLIQSSITKGELIITDPVTLSENFKLMASSE